MVYDTGDWDEDFPRVCDDCLALTLIGMGREKPWFGPEPKDRLMIVHGPLARTERYVYALKPSDASFCMCQTTDIPMRSRNNGTVYRGRPGGRTQSWSTTRPTSAPRDVVNRRERELTALSRTPVGQRTIRQAIERFRAPLRLLDLET